MIRGEVVWFFAYDVAFEAKLEQAAELLAGRSPGFRKPARYRGTPQDMLTYPSLGLELPEGAAADLPGAPGVGRAVKLFPVGAVSVTLRVPFEEPALDDLMPCCLLGEIEGSELRKLARASAEEMVQAVGASLVKPLPNWDRCEAYKAVCITTAEGLDQSARG